MTTGDGKNQGGGGGVVGAVPATSSTSPEGAFDVDLVSLIANELYADTPPHQPESAVPKSDPVRGRDVNEEASSLTDAGNAPENALGLQGVTSPHGLADPSYYFMEHPESPENPQGTPNPPAAPAPTDAMHPESSVDPLSAQGGASQSGADLSPAAAGGQQQVPADTGYDAVPQGLVAAPAPDQPPSDAPRATPSEPPSPAAPDTARPESGLDPTKIQALMGPALGGIPSLFGPADAGHATTPDADVPSAVVPSQGGTTVEPDGKAQPGGSQGGGSQAGGSQAGGDQAGGGQAAPTGEPPATGGLDLHGIESLGGLPALFGTAGAAVPFAPGVDASVPGLDPTMMAMGGLDPSAFGMEGTSLLPGDSPSGETTETVPAEPKGGGEGPGYYFLPEAPVPETGADAGGGGLDPHVVRNDFPILQQKVHGKPLIWMDNAATTQKPQAVIDRISQFYERDYSNIHRGAHTLSARATDAYEDAREKVRDFLGAGSADELIFVRGTTEGVNLIAQTWGRKYVKGGDEILLSQLEHHANIVPWQMLAQEKGAKIRVIPVTDRGEIMLEEYGRLLNPRTCIVGITQVSNALGTVNPVEEMIAAAHRHGIPVLVDGAQSVPHMRVDLRENDADFFVFSGHKIYGPTGVGVVYGKQEHLVDMPPWQGGGNMIQAVTFEQSTYSAPPAKFEAGTPTITDAVGLGEAIDYVQRIGIDNINRYEHTLTEYAMERLHEVPGIRLIGTAPNKVSVLSFVLEGTRNEDVGRYLDSEGIAVRAGHHCAMPTMQRMGVSGTVRPSLAIYNTHDEVDFLVEVLKRYRSA